MKNTLNFRKIDFLITSSNRWKSSENLMYVLNPLINNEDCLSFFGKEILSTNIKLTNEQLNLLDIKKFDFEELLKCLSDKKWVMKHDDEWFSELYHYLGTNMDQVNVNMIKLFEVPLIRLSDGETSKITDSIFFNFGNIPEFFTFISNSFILTF